MSPQTTWSPLANDLVLISPSASVARMNNLFKICEKYGAELIQWQKMFILLILYLSPLFSLNYRLIEKWGRKKEKNKHWRESCVLKVYQFILHKEKRIRKDSHIKRPEKTMLGTFPAFFSTHCPGNVYIIEVFEKKIAD